VFISGENYLSQKTREHHRARTFRIPRIKTGAGTRFACRAIALAKASRIPLSAFFNLTPSLALAPIKPGGAGESEKAESMARHPIIFSLRLNHATTQRPSLHELDVGRWALGVRRFRRMSLRIIAADHTGFTVSNLERSLAFWRDVLGFELSHRAHHTGELASEVTGVPGAEISIAVLKGYGHKIELLEYLAPADRRIADLRPCDVGSVHVAFTVKDLDGILRGIETSGWKPAGKPQTLQSGPNAGKRVVYVRDPDGTTIEFIQPPNNM